MDNNNKERVTGFMNEEGKKMNEQKGSPEAKLMDDTMQAMFELVEASMKLSTKFAQMPENELTSDEKEFVAATAKAGMLLMMGAILFKPEGGK